jgi:hypothetical protein
VATTADINAGTFDGVVGGTTPAAGTFTTLIGTNVDGIVGANTPAAGTFTSVGVGSGAITTTGTLGAGATTVTSLNASDGNITNVEDIAMWVTFRLTVLGADDLVIENSATTGFSTLSASTSYSGWAMGDETDSQLGIVRYYNSAHANANQMHFFTAGVQAIIVDANQKVGIGVTPEFSLHVQPTAIAGASAGTGMVTLEGAHNTVLRPVIMLKNETAGTTFTGGLRWIDGNANEGWGIENNRAWGDAIEFNYNGTLRGAWVGTNFFIGDQENAKMTVGLTINQGANDDEATAWKSSDVAHSFTDLVEADTYGTVKKAVPTLGGVELRGITEHSSQAVNVVGYINIGANTAKTTGGQGVINCVAQQLSTNTAGAVDANGNIFSCGADGAVHFIVDNEGDLYADSGTSTTAVTVYDDFDDIELIRSFSLATGKNTIANKWDSFIKYNEDTLVELGILGARLKDKPLYCVTKLQKLQNGAIEQLYTKLLDMVDELTDTKNRLQSAETKLLAIGA